MSSKQNNSFAQMSRSLPSPTLDGFVCSRTESEPRPEFRRSFKSCTCLTPRSLDDLCALDFMQMIPEKGLGCLLVARRRRCLQLHRRDEMAGSDSGRQPKAHAGFPGFHGFPALDGGAELMLRGDVPTRRGSCVGGIL